MMSKLSQSVNRNSFMSSSRGDEAQTSLDETRHTAGQSLLTSAATIGNNPSETSNLRCGARRAFSLIEMLVVIAIIGLLAALVVGGASHFRETSVRAKVQTELNQVVSAIESYHKKYGFYPQGNGASSPDPVKAPLYYELTGTEATANAVAYFQVKGIVNTLPDEETKRIPNFFANIGIEGKNYKVVDNASGALALTAGYRGPDGDVNPWRYVSKNPTNNTETYDLWAEVLVGNKKIVIGNWKD